MPKSELNCEKRDHINFAILSVFTFAKILIKSEDIFV